MVISAVNFTEGGPLTVLREFSAAACEFLPGNWNIVLLAHDKALLDLSRAEVIAVPEAKRSWPRRLYVEWYKFAACANKLKPDIWISLHDITPRVRATRRIVYCHNPMPFYRLRLRDIWLDPKTILFRYLYVLVYRFNLRRNYAIVVQQSWLRDKFRNWVGAGTRIIVSHPAASPVASSASPRQRPIRKPVTFLYPALPRVFKNFETVLSALRQLENSESWGSQVVLTVDGTENRYAAWLIRRFGDLRTARFVGRRSQRQMTELYASADCLLFASLLETWGLPISEAKRLGLPMLLADLPYAREAVGTYDRVAFFDVADARQLARKMLAFQNGDIGFEPITASSPEAPFASDWHALMGMITEGLN